MRPVMLKVPTNEKPSTGRKYRNFLSWADPEKRKVDPLDDKKHTKVPSNRATRPWGQRQGDDLSKLYRVIESACHFRGWSKDLRSVAVSRL